MLQTWVRKGKVYLSSGELVRWGKCFKVYMGEWKVLDAGLEFQVWEERGILCVCIGNRVLDMEYLWRGQNFRCGDLGYKGLYICV